MNGWAGFAVSANGFCDFHDARIMLDPFDQSFKGVQRLLDLMVTENTRSKKATNLNIKARSNSQPNLTGQVYQPTNI
jgi:hypothetical protein